MHKTIKLFISFILVLILLTSTTVCDSSNAANTANPAQLFPDEQNLKEILSAVERASANHSDVILNGERIEFKNQLVMENTETMIPLKEFCALINAQVNWDPGTKSITITKDNLNIALKSDNKTVLKNNNAILLNTPPKAYNGITYVPVSFMNEVFGYTVQAAVNGYDIIVLTNGKFIAKSISDILYAKENNLPFELFGGRLKVNNIYDASYAADNRLAFEYAGEKVKIGEHWELRLALKHNIPYEIASTEVAASYDKAKAIINTLIKPNMNEYEKELAIYEYIVKNTEYDANAAINGYTAESKNSYNAYGMLVNGRAVCQGYAEAADLLFTLAGIESILITGDDHGIPHAWNIVKIDGEYYHVDSTLDDSKEIRHYYLNLSDKDIEKAHTWDRKSYPECNGSKYNYFSYNNMTVSDRNELKQYIKEQIKSRKAFFYVKLNGFEVEDKDLFDIAAELRLRTFGFSMNRELGVIKLDGK